MELLALLTIAIWILDLLWEAGIIGLVDPSERRREGASQ